MEGGPRLGAGLQSKRLAMRLQLSTAAEALEFVASPEEAILAQLARLYVRAV